MRSDSPSPADVRALREEFSLTQAEFAALLPGVTARQVQRWESETASAEARRSMDPRTWILYQAVLRSRRVRSELRGLGIWDPRIPSRARYRNPGARNRT